MRSGRAVVLGVIAPVLFAAPGVPARADVVQLPDPRGDLMTQDLVTGEYVARRDEKSLDVVHTVFRHRRHRIRVRLDFTSLEPLFRWGADFAVFVQTPDGKGSIDIRTGPRGNVTSRFVAFRQLARTCHLHDTVDYTRSFVVIGAPRRCFGSPSWVRLGAYVRAARRLNAAVEDDAARAGVVHEMLGHPTMSRPLARGSW
jgi:hypothetical protein